MRLRFPYSFHISALAVVGKLMGYPCVEVTAHILSMSYTLIPKSKRGSSTFPRVSGSPFWKDTTDL